MGTFIFIMLCVVFVVYFYLWDDYQHKKLMVNTMLEAHWQERYLVRYKVKDISEKYPTLARLASSFANSDIHYDSEITIKNAVSVNRTIKEQLDSEVRAIVDKKDREAAYILNWYMFTCVIIKTKTSNVTELNEQSKNISNSEYEKVSGGDLCLA